MFEKRSEDWDQVAALIDTINFRSAAFAILRRHYYGGMLKGVFEAHLRFANLEEVLLHVSTQPVNRVKSLHVTIRYLGSSEDGHRLFPIHAERALRHVARRGGFRQLNIYHALVLKDPQIEALERGGYGRRQSPEGMQRWAKRIEL